jgi:hypothetical protein
MQFLYFSLRILFELSLLMLQRQCNTERKLSNKRNFYQQEFFIHHPLLDRIIEAKLQKCLKYGQAREVFVGSKMLSSRENVHVIEAPFVAGSIKKLELKNRSRKIISGLQASISRPKTTNTVIRSRTS